jgi:hypothetical protein
VVSPHVLVDYWPGIQLYYQPVKYTPEHRINEDLEEGWDVDRDFLDDFE